jgi:hypothetical protein
MKQKDAITIAKSIRNIKAPQGFKNDIAEAIGEALQREDQFFNYKQFIDIATMEFQEK